MPRIKEFPTPAAFAPDVVYAGGVRLPAGRKANSLGGISHQFKIRRLNSAESETQ